MTKSITQFLEQLHDRFKPLRDGEVADYIPELARVAPDQFGIALVTAMRAWLNAATLAVLLVRRGHLAFDARLRRCVPRLILASAAMALAVWWGAGLLAGPLAGDEARRIVALAVLVAVGGALFALLSLLTGAVRLKDLRAAVSRRT